GRGDVLRATDVGEPGVLRADARVVQPCGDGVRLDRLTVLVLQHVRLRTVQDARAATLDGRSMTFGLDAVASGLDAVEFDALVIEERIEHADGIRSASDTGDDRVGQTTGLVEKLLARLFADDL